MGIRGHLAVCLCVVLLAIGAVALTRQPDNRVYAPTEAAAHAGERIAVGGKASIYLSRDGTSFIDLGGSGKSSPFAAVIFKEDAGTFPNIFSYDGKMIEVSGLVQKFRGKPQIVLKTADQLHAK